MAIIPNLVKPPKLKKPKKATDKKVDDALIEHRTQWNKKLGFNRPQYISFMEIMRSKGFECYLYEARRTRSKYVTVTCGTNSIKVRFSDHKPIAIREARGDCDFFVGRTHAGWTTTAQAVLFAIQHFGRCTV